MNLFKLFGEIAVKNDEANDNIDETKKKAKDAGKDVSQAFSDMGSAAVKVGKTIATGLATAAAAMGALIAAAESSREYRTALGKLDTAFETSGHSAEAAKATYKELQAVLGETDQAVEAANFLAKLCTTEEELAAWTDICAGVYGTFGASLPIEGLTEAANETARCGQLTGSLADAINWASKSGETFGVTLKEDTEANKEWNAAVEAAASAEDFFNLALQECSTEQERQTLIMETLNGLYSDAAKKYKETNAEVMAANKATERMNELWAKVGKKAEPIVTAFKNGIATLGEALIDMVSDADVEEFCDKLANGFGVLAEDVIPAFIDVLGFVTENFHTIIAALAGAGAAYLVYEAAVVVATIAQQGLNAVLSATPTGLIVAVLGAATVALLDYKTTAHDTAISVSYLSKEEQELVDKANEAADALRDQKAAASETANGVMSHMDYVSSLADELTTLADSSGKVEEADRSRAQFILNELNEALGTEYTMVDGVIQKYDDLQSSIKEVITQKTANALLDAHSQAYAIAIDQKTGAFKKLTLAEKELTEAQKDLALAEKEYAEWFNGGGGRFAGMNFAEAEEAYFALRDGVEALQIAYDEAAAEYYDYYTTIEQYTKAEAAALEGNYTAVIDILKSKGSHFVEYADTVDTETGAVLDALALEAYEAGVAAEQTKFNFMQGVSGYTQEMVDEAQQAYEDAMAAFSTAYTDAHAVGSSIGSGVSDGISLSTGDAILKIRRLVKDTVNAGLSEVETYRPTSDKWYNTAEHGIMSYGAFIDGSHASGLDYVPFDGYVAELHKGEMVVPSQSAEFIRAGGGNGAVVQMLARILNAIEENGLANVSLTVGNREFGRLVREAL